ncbi:MAG TPA: isochorismatase family cysteine hydrolase [Candidatus Binatia bacterium]|nr:isochorismatase family cysteine hydrolase [Candidatus Binatia bacterium]
MPGTAEHRDRLGHAPDKSATALLLVDVINPIEFDTGDDLLRHALPMARALRELKRRAKSAGVPVIYVNDNFGRWRSEFPKIVEYCLQPGVRGKAVVEQLPPDEDDYFVLKPKHSAFFQTPLEILLDYLSATTLIITGMASDICVLFSANDAYLRDFNIIVPPDCTASEDEERNREVLMLMQRVLKADIRPSAEISFENIRTSTRNTH